MPTSGGQGKDRLISYSSEHLIASQTGTTVDTTLPFYSLRGLCCIIYRDPEQILVPQADTVLLPGDVLALLGEQDQLEAAVRFLTELATQKVSATTAPPQVARVTLAEGSPFVSRTLAELGLREELGVLIVGVRRGADQIANPGPDFRGQPGDILYLWGVPERVEEARHRAGSRAEDDGDP